MSGRGLIAADGSVSGTATDSNGATLSFTMPADSAFEVLNYTAPVTWAAVYQNHNANFVFTIPKKAPAGLAGLCIIVKVHDGGPGYVHDTYAHGSAQAPTTGQLPNTRSRAAATSHCPQLSAVARSAVPSSRRDRTFVSARATAPADLRCPSPARSPKSAQISRCPGPRDDPGWEKCAMRER